MSAESAAERHAAVARAIEAIRAGGMLILVDDEDRENEGDLVVPAQFATPDAVNFMARHARGLVCLALTRQRVEQLGLPLMSAHNGTRHQTAFTISIEAREGVTTGISAHDRARTISVAINPECGRDDIVTPGHIFPLMAREGGWRHGGDAARPSRGGRDERGDEPWPTTSTSSSSTSLSRISARRSRQSPATRAGSPRAVASSCRCS